MANKIQFEHLIKYKKEQRKLNTKTMYYINYANQYTPAGRNWETIDEAETRNEALYLLNEYRISDSTGMYKISREYYI